MEYDYEPLLAPENNFYIARKKLENEIIHKSLTLECEFDLEILKVKPDFKNWFEKSIIELEKELIREREKLAENKTYFFGCSFEVYKLNYDERLQSYLKKYYDATEQDFIKYELSKKFDVFYTLVVNRYDKNQKLERCVLEMLLAEQIIFSLKARNKFLNDKLNDKIHTIKDYKTENWFKVGLLFATGEMDLLLNKFGNGTKIAEHLGNKSYRPFITESISDTNKLKSVQSIYNVKKYPLIYKHCIENEITMKDTFIKFCIENAPE